MTKNQREDKIIEAKSKEWKRDVDVFFNKATVEIPKLWRVTKKEMNKIADWYWFNNSKTPGERAWHVILWLLITRAIIRIFYNV